MTLFLQGSILYKAPKTQIQLSLDSQVILSEKCTVDFTFSFPV